MSHQELNLELWEIFWHKILVWLLSKKKRTNEQTQLPCKEMRRANINNKKKLHSIISRANTYSPNYVLLHWERKSCVYITSSLVKSNISQHRTSKCNQWKVSNIPLNTSEEMNNSSLKDLIIEDFLGNKKRIYN